MSWYQETDSCITRVTSGYNWIYDKSSVSVRRMSSEWVMRGSVYKDKGTSERVKVGPWPQLGVYCLSCWHGLFMLVPAGPGWLLCAGNDDIRISAALNVGWMVSSLNLNYAWHIQVSFWKLVVIIQPKTEINVGLSDCISVSNLARNTLSWCLLIAGVRWGGWLSDSPLPYLRSWLPLTLPHPCVSCHINI